MKNRKIKSLLNSLIKKKLSILSMRFFRNKWTKITFVIKFLKIINFYKDITFNIVIITISISNLNRYNAVLYISV